MSIRVNNTDVGVTTQTGLTEQVKPGGAGGSGAQVSGKTGEDVIDVSESTENINSALQNENLQHSQRIQQLGNLVAEGRYTVDSLDLSRSLVSGAIINSAGE